MCEDLMVNKDNFIKVLVEELFEQGFDNFVDIHKRTNEEIFLLWKNTKRQSLLFVLLNKNRKFLFNEVRKLQFMYNSIFDDEDLLNIASIGFIKGCEHFDCSKGAKLITYVYYWIHSELNREIRKHGYAVNLPAHVWSDFSKLRKILKTDEYATIEQIIQKTGFTLEKYNQLMEIQQNCLNIEYLDVCQDEFDKNLLLNNDIKANKVNSESLSEEEENADKVLLVSNVTKAMSVLSEKEKDIILKRFCVEEEDKMTLREIAEKYGVSSQRVNEIEKRALGKLRSTTILNSYKNAIINDNEYIEDYKFKKDNISYIPSTQEIICRIITLQKNEYNIVRMYEEYLICSKQNGYKDFIAFEEFKEKIENYIKNNQK